MWGKRAFEVRSAVRTLLKFRFCCDERLDRTQLCQLLEWIMKPRVFESLFAETWRSSRLHCSSAFALPIIIAASLHRCMAKRSQRSPDGL